MPTVLKDMLASKKFIFTLVATVLLILAGKTGMLPMEKVQSFLELLWPTYLGAQGLADLGKHAAIVKAKNQPNNAE
jgi:hypothetical protein